MAEVATMTLEIPQNILDAAHLNLADVRLELAWTIYDQRRLSLGKTRELAGLTLGEFRHWLATRRNKERHRRLSLGKTRELAGLTLGEFRHWLATRRNKERHLHLIENFFCKFKQFRVIATRYDKTARNFLCTLYSGRGLCMA